MTFNDIMSIIAFLVWCWIIAFLVWCWMWPREY